MTRQQSYSHIIGDLRVTFRPKKGFTLHVRYPGGALWRRVGWVGDKYLVIGTIRLERLHLGGIMRDEESGEWQAWINSLPI